MGRIYLLITNFLKNGGHFWSLVSQGQFWVKSWWVTFHCHSDKSLPKKIVSYHGKLVAGSSLEFEGALCPLDIPHPRAWSLYIGPNCWNKRCSHLPNWMIGKGLRSWHGGCLRVRNCERPLPRMNVINSINTKLLNSSLTQQHEFHIAIH